MTGQDKKAQEIGSTTPEVFFDPRIINIYARLKQYGRVIDAYKILIQKSPDNIQYYGSLASAYLQSGQASLALAELESMKTKFPQAKGEIDAAIKEVQGIKK